jgi:tRNA uridine 5-carbamoylmethylation protein Kti12
LYTASQHATLECSAGTTVWAVTIIEFDVILKDTLEQPGGHISHSWQEARKRFYDTLEQAASSLGNSKCKAVIADDNFHLKSMRRQCYQIACRTGAAYAQIYLPCSPEEAKLNNLARDQSSAVSVTSLERLCQEMESPLATGCIWDRGTLVYDGETDIQDLCSRLVAVTPQQRHQESGPGGDEPPERLIHAFDMYGRQTITEILRHIQVDKPAVALRLNHERRGALVRMSQVEGFEALQGAISDLQQRFANVLAEFNLEGFLPCLTNREHMLQQTRSKGVGS